jgi:hypothetical protein
LDAKIAPQGVTIASEFAAEAPRTHRCCSSEVSVTAYRGDNLGGHFVLNGETRQDEIFGKRQP